MATKLTDPADVEMHKAIMRLARPLSAWTTARVVQQYLSPGIHYGGMSKGYTIDCAVHMLRGRSHDGFRAFKCTGTWSGLSRALTEAR